MDSSHPTFTLHHGERSATFQEHPVEVARRALLAAADLENEAGPWAGLMRRVASSLPDRERLRRATPDGLPTRDPRPVRPPRARRPRL